MLYLAYSLLSFLFYFLCIVIYLVIYLLLPLLPCFTLDVLLFNNNKRPLTPKSMPPAGDEHAKLKT